MSSNMIDDLEERLRVACHAAVPRLLDNAEEAHGPDADSAPLQPLVLHGTDGRRPPAHRARVIGGIAAGLLLLTAAAAIATRDQPVTTQGSRKPLAETSSSSVGEWVTVPGPPLVARWANLSISTGTGWFVWGGITPLPGSQTALNDGAYLDSASGEWRLLPTAPISASTQVDFGLWTGTEIIVIQGGDAPHMAAFDPASFTWRTISIPADRLAAWPRGDGGGFKRGISSFVDGRVVVFFPNDPEQGLAPEVLLYDPANNTWQVGATPPASMTSLTGPITSSPSQLFVVGGGQRNSDAICLGGWWLYTFDVSKNVWTESAILRGNWLPAVAAWVGGRVVLAGGTECTSGSPVRTTMTFDPTTPSFRTMAEMPVDVSYVLGSSVTVGERVAAIVPGGQPLVYDPTSDLWQVGPSFLPSGATSGDTTMVAIGTTLAVWSAGIMHDDGGGNSSCCYPTGEAFTYSPGPASGPLESPEPTQDSVAFDNDGTVPCADFGCGQFDAIPVAPGVDDFYVGPASLGDPHISESIWNGLIRCTELDTSGDCARLEGLGIVALVDYGSGQADQVQIGTTFGAHVTLEEYATMLGPMQPAAPTPAPSTVRGHSAVLFEDNSQYPAVMWEERPGVLVWVAVPPSRQAELTSIAEAVVLQKGPSTIPGRLLVPNTGEPWRARNNNGTGLIVAKFSGKECVGWGYIDKCSDRIEDRTFAAHFPSAVYIAGSVPSEVESVRVRPESGDPVEVTPFAYGGSSSRFYQVTLPPDTVATVDWLGADGNVIATYQPSGGAIVGSE